MAQKSKSNPTPKGKHKAYWIHLVVPYAEGSTNLVGHLGFRAGGKKDGEVRVLHRAGESGPAVIQGLLDDAAAQDIACDSSMVVSLPLDSRMMLAHQVLAEAEKHKFQFFREIPYEHEPAGGVLWEMRPDIPIPSLAEAVQEVERLNMEAQSEAQSSEYPQALSLLLQALELSVKVLGWCDLHTAVTVRTLSQVYRATGNFRNQKTARLLLADMAAGIRATPAEKIPQDDTNYQEFIGMLAQEAADLDDDDLRQFFRKHLQAAGGQVEEEKAPAEEETLDLDDILSKARSILDMEGLLGEAPAEDAAASKTSAASSRGVSEWFVVSFDDNQIHLKAAPPGGEAWTADFDWKSIERIVYKCEDFGSDGMYLFVQGREASYAIPTEAKGGMDLWFKIIDRGVFDPELAVKASMGSAGEVFVWPPEKQ